MWKPYMDKALLKRMVTENAERSCLAADHSRFNRHALMKINIHVVSVSGRNPGYWMEESMPEMTE